MHSAFTSIEFYEINTCAERKSADIMIDEDLKRRAQRLVNDDPRVEDLDRLFLGQRGRSHGRTSIREIGDFVAHRDERCKGPVTQVVRDVFASVHTWLLGMLGERATSEDIRLAAEANLRLASDEQIVAGCGLERSFASKNLRKALLKFDHGQRLSKREATVLEYFGNRFIWKPAITDEVLFQDLRYVLSANGLLSEVDASSLITARTFIGLYVIALMHGCKIVLANGDHAELVAGFANRHGKLEVKAWMTPRSAPKPIVLPLCIFWTDLSPEGVCEAELLNNPTAWLNPIELTADGTLATLSMN